MEIKLTKNQDGTYDKVELVDAELENGSVVQVVSSRETLNEDHFAEVLEQINQLQKEKADEITKAEDHIKEQTARIDALLAPLLALKAKHDETKADVAEEIK